MEINSKGYLSPFAVTRPKKNLYITFPATINGKPSKRSRFLKEINLPIQQGEKGRLSTRK
ncbi:hypothetical protein [Bacillus cereus]|nr:hypothetical protein [Bacillus cereus]PDZ24616.1 hypothetical protein CON41_02440 [Bacillus cereus]PFA67636.1 hypothetical protein CN403_22880 [Bacillus cereus]